MALAHRFLLIILLVLFVSFPLAVSCAEEGQSKTISNVVLTPADQMILEAIARVNERIDKLSNELNGRIDKLSNELNGRIDKVNERIDKLWITMLGGFLGVMAFIGGIVFWDRRTFLKRAREECRDEVTEDRKKLEGLLIAMKKLGKEFPEVREVLNTFGLL